MEAVAAYLPHHTIVPEPYEILEERGYEFAHPPTVEDYVAQLRLALTILRRRSPNLVLDRCPLDFLGYISASPGADRFDFETWREPIAQAMQRLDLVFVVHADPKHDPVTPTTDAAFRLAVDDVLRDIIDGDCLDLCEGVEIVALDGPWDRRVERVLAHIDRLRPQHSPSPRR